MKPKKITKLREIIFAKILVMLITCHPFLKRGTISENSYHETEGNAISCRCRMIYPFACTACFCVLVLTAVQSLF